MVHTERSGELDVPVGADRLAVLEHLHSLRERVEIRGDRGELRQGAGGHECAPGE